MERDNGEIGERAKWRRSVWELSCRGVHLLSSTAARPLLSLTLRRRRRVWREAKVLAFESCGEDRLVRMSPLTLETRSYSVVTSPLTSVAWMGANYSNCNKEGNPSELACCEYVCCFSALVRHALALGPWMPGGLFKIARLKCLLESVFVCLQKPVFSGRCRLLSTIAPVCLHVDVFKHNII